MELGKLDMLEELIRKEYTQFSGFVLEKYFRQLYAEQERVTEVSHWWDSQGGNEIDLIAVERLDHRATVAEVKRNAQKYNPQTLAQKYEHIKKYLRDYQVQLCGLSMQDM